MNVEVLFAGLLGKLSNFQVDVVWLYRADPSTNPKGWISWRWDPVRCLINLFPCHSYRAEKRRPIYNQCIHRSRGIYAAGTSVNFQGLLDKFDCPTMFATIPRNHPKFDCKFDARCPFENGTPYSSKLKRGNGSYPMLISSRIRTIQYSDESSSLGVSRE